MIARLRGVLVEAGEEDLVVDVAGVGYAVRCGTRTLARLPAPGEEVLVHVEHQFSAEQGPRLYGFLSRDERRAFVTLQSIQGVGPKAALGVLDVLSPGELAGAVARDDKAAVARANGVGPKLAARIVLELKGKTLGDAVFEPGAALRPAPAAVAAPTVAGEAVAALLGLGVSEPLARRAVEQAVIRLGEDATLPAVIKAALQETAR